MEDVMNPEVLISGNGAIKVAAVGDSLTYGYGLENREHDAYPSILAEMLGAHYQVHNFGLSGRSLLSTSDYPYLKEKSAQLSLQSEADIVIIMIGSNDSRPFIWNEQQFIAEYGNLVDRYTAMSSQPDVFLVVPPYVPTERFGLDNHVVKEKLQVLIPNIGEEKGLPVINLYQLTEGKNELYSDGLHLTAEGNRVIAQAIYQEIVEK